MTSAERSMVFAPDLASVRAGRHFVRDTLLEWGLEELVDDAQLCVSEIVTNAVLHAGTELEVALCHDEDERRVLVEVSDAAAGDPIAGTGVDPVATSGRGLQIVEAVAAEWGVHRRDPADGVDGKTIWVSLALPDARSLEDDDNVRSLAAHRSGGASAQPAAPGGERRPDRATGSERTQTG